MTAMLTGQAVAFWLLAPVMILAALGMVVSRKPVHSTLCLATVMMSLAVQYAALDAPFLFAVQIIVYTGAILMLFVFVVMLVGVDSRDSLVEVLRGQRVLAALAALAIIVLLIGAIGSAFVNPPVGLVEANAARGTNVNGLAELIFGRYVVLFQAAGALLLTATVAALILAHRERLSPHRSQGERMRDRMRRYAETGEHPGPLPTPGVYARRNAVDVPALLPDGSPAPTSVSETLRARGQVLDAREVAAPTARTLAAIQDSDEVGIAGSDLGPRQSVGADEPKDHGPLVGGRVRDLNEVVTAADVPPRDASGADEPGDDDADRREGR